MDRIETKYFSYCKACGILCAIKATKLTTMNTTLLVKSVTAAALFTAIFVGFANVNADLSKIGVGVGWFAGAAILGFAALDARRSA
jgi:hypothetical protein